MGRCLGKRSQERLVIELDFVLGDVGEGLRKSGLTLDFQELGAIQ